MSPAGPGQVTIGRNGLTGRFGARNLSPIEGGKPASLRVVSPAGLREGTGVRMPVHDQAGQLVHRREPNPGREPEADADRSGNRNPVRQPALNPVVKPG